MNPSHHVFLGKSPLRPALYRSGFNSHPSFHKSLPLVLGQPKASSRAAEHSCRSGQDALPILDAVRAAGRLKSVHPFHIPGHKVGAASHSHVHHSHHCHKVDSADQVRAIQRGQGAPESIKDLLGSTALQYDLTELPGELLQHAGEQREGPLPCRNACKWTTLTTVGAHPSPSMLQGWTTSPTPRA